MTVIAPTYKNHRYNFDRIQTAEAKWPAALTRDTHLLANYLPNRSALFRVRFSSY